MQTLLCQSQNKPQFYIKLAECNQNKLP